MTPPPPLPETPHDTAPFVLDCRGRPLDCRFGQGRLRETGTYVMGILNVTPDSFYDGGRYLDRDAALRQAEAMLEEGATLIDVGGESSRPPGKTYGAGAAAVPAEAEAARVVPVIAAIAERFPEALISVDTYKPGVARVALEAGAHLVNDITGLRYFPETATVAAEAGAPLIVMHALGRPGEMPPEHRYGNVIEDVSAALRTSVRVAEEAGVRDVVVDPGFGFGKSPEENLRLVRGVDTFLSGLGRPVLIGLSRKSTIGAVLGADPAPVPGQAGRGQAVPVPAEQRLFGTLGATAVAVLRGRDAGAYPRRPPDGGDAPPARRLYVSRGSPLP